MEGYINANGTIKLPEKLIKRYDLITNKKIIISDTGRGIDIQIEAPPFKISDNLYVVGGMGTSYQWDGMVYLINGSKDLFLIDSGTALGFEKVVENIKKIGFNPQNIKQIILTHAHFDHFDGGCLWKKQFGTKIIINPSGKQVIENKNNNKTAAFIFGEEHKPYEIDATLDFNKELILDKYVLKPIHLPGHTPDNTGFYGKIDDNSVCFTGDICGAYNKRWGSSVNDEKQSVQKLMKLKIDILCHGHRYFSKNLVAPLLENWNFLCEDEMFSYFLARKHQR